MGSSGRLDSEHSEDSSTPRAAGATEDSLLGLLLKYHHPKKPTCLRKLTSSNLSLTLLSSSSRRPSVSWILTRTAFCPPPTWWLPSPPTERALVVVTPRPCSMRSMDP